MQRVAFTMKIKPGTEAEYRRRHQHVLPELLTDLKKAGCAHYSIYLDGLTLFACMDVEDFPQFLALMSASQASERWENSMRDILLRETDPTTNFPFLLPEVFHLD